jgi:thymidylate kinase
VSIIIVEGPDGAGKTTLIRNLREESKRYFWVASSSGPPKDLEEIRDVLRWVDKAAELQIPVIFDRFPLISESVYGPVLRGKCLLDEMGDSEHISVTALLRKINRVVYCRPSLEVIRKNVIEGTTPQLLGVLENLKDIVERYDKLMDILEDEIQVYHYDYRIEATPIEEVFF